MSGSQSREHNRNYNYNYTDCRSQRTRTRSMSRVRAAQRTKAHLPLISFAWHRQWIGGSGSGSQSASGSGSAGSPENHYTLLPRIADVCCGLQVCMRVCVRETVRGRKGERERKSVCVSYYRLGHRNAPNVWICILNVDAQNTCRYMDGHYLTGRSLVSIKWLG